jgi:hypothetical protein
VELSESVGGVSMVDILVGGRSGLLVNSSYGFGGRDRCRESVSISIPNLGQCLFTTLQ